MSEDNIVDVEYKEIPKIPKEFPVEKFYRDSKLCTIGEGTTEIQKVVISRNILK